MTRCYACGRTLSDPESVKAGIGPVCRGRRRREETAQEKLDREAGRCHHGFNCGDPRHVETLLGRLMQQVEEAWPDWLKGAGINLDDDEIDGEPYGDALYYAQEQCKRLAYQIVLGLGLERPPVDVPVVERQGLEVMLRVTGHLMHPANEIQPGQFRVPADIGRQYRNTVLRGLGICPHGLDCTDPGRAVAGVYSILSILRHDVEPLFRDTSYGGLVGASDAAYIACMNMLQVLGLEDEGAAIFYRDLPKLRKAAARNARRWERRQARKRGAA